MPTNPRSPRRPSPAASVGASVAPVAVFPSRSEKAFQEQLIHTLGLFGYRCKELGKSRAKVTCKACGVTDWPRGWQGNTPGAPDLLVTHNGWPRGIWLSLELKTEKGDIRSSQVEDIEAGRTLLCRDLETPLRALVEYEEGLCDGGYAGAHQRSLRLTDFLKMNEGRLS